MVHNWNPFSPAHAEWLQPFILYALRATSIYLQRLGKNNTDNRGALLERKAACLQHNVDCLFRNYRAKAHTCAPDVRGQSLSSPGTLSVSMLHAADSETPIHPPRDCWIWLLISIWLRSKRQTLGGADLTPPQTLGKKPNPEA